MAKDKSETNLKSRNVHGGYIYEKHLNSFENDNTFLKIEQIVKETIRKYLNSYFNVILVYLIKNKLEITV